MLIDEFAQWLQSQGQGSVGATIFKLHRPASPLICVSMHATGGYPRPRYGVRELPTVQLVARADGPKGALVKAYAIYNLLPRKGGLVLGGLHAFCAEALNSPAYVGEEETESGVAHLASFNLAFDLRRPSS